MMAFFVAPLVASNAVNDAVLRMNGSAIGKKETGTQKKCEF